MEIGLIISIGTIIASIGATWATMKIKGDSNSHSIEKVDAKIDALLKKIDSHSESITELKTKQGSAITAKEVSEHYLSKEHFRQFEKHIDDKFTMVIDGQGKILSEIQGLKK